MTKMTKKYFFMALLSMVLVLSLLAATGEAASPTPTSSPTTTPKPTSTLPPMPSVAPVKLSYPTASIGGAVYPAGVTMGETINKYLPGVQITVEVSGGSVSNVQLVEDGKAHIAIGSSGTDFFAMNSMDWAKQKYIKSRSLCVIFYPMVHIVALKRSGIESVYDLKGKTISGGPRGSTTSFLTETMMQALNIPANIQYMSVAETTRKLGDGLLDAVTIAIGIPWAGYIEISSTQLCRILPLPDEVVDKIRAVAPYYTRQIIPANTYKDQKYDIPSLGISQTVNCHVDLPDNLVYALVRTWFEHQPEMARGMPALSAMKPELISDAIYPLHPGAYKYYQEIGIKIPDRLKPRTLTR